MDSAYWKGSVVWETAASLNCAKYHFHLHPHFPMQYEEISKQGMGNQESWAMPAPLSHAFLGYGWGTGVDVDG